MRALVVYESMFGNTRVIAEAITRGLAGGPGNGMDVRCVEVGRAPTTVDEGLDLLVVGAPTHAFSLSRASTRRDALDQGEGREIVSPGIGVREWIEAVEAPRGTDVATFDTKVRKPRLPGSAAKAARKRLHARGLHPVAAPTTFYVGGTTGPLLDGEARRAGGWGGELAARASRRAGGRRVA